MNANKLAEIQAFKTEELTMWERNTTATMLRQQQERIKQLEETQEYLYKTHDADKAQIEALKRPNNVVGVPADKLAEMQAEIEALKALLVKEQDESFDRTASHMAGEYVSYPVKEPTDLELLKMIGEKFTRFGFEGDYVVEDSELIDFARAILRKAQEK